MARKNRKNRIYTTDAAPALPAPTKAQAFNAQVNKLMTVDAFQNLMARTGFGSTAMLEGTAYPLTRLTKNYTLMNSLYRNSWIARRIIDIIPNDMLRQGWKYLMDIPPEDIDKLQRAERLTQLYRQLRKGLNWGRLYGGAGGLLMIEGQEDQLDEPLDVESIMPGQYKGLLIVDRWSGIYPQLGLVSDISSPEFGLPEFYQFQDYTKKETYKVHHSRIVRFIGDDLPEWELEAETYWGASIIESVYEELKKRDNASANIANLIFLANLRILRMNDLGQVLSATNINAQRDLYNVIQAQTWLQSNFGMYVMDKDDEFQSIRTSFSDLDEIYECFMMDIAGAAQIPVTRLFGRSPAGMNATGESDMRNYYDVVEQNQEGHLSPALDKILPVLCMSTLGYIPDDLDYAYNPIQTPTDEEIGEIVRWKTEAIYNAHDRGIIPDKTALQELKQMSDESGLFTNITDDMINSASDEAINPALAIPDDPAKEVEEDLPDYDDK